jgi:hypothetical protein
VLKRVALAGRKGLRGAGRHAWDGHAGTPMFHRPRYTASNVMIEINVAYVSSSILWIMLAST